jgi:uncharacterized protein (TIGR01777 family)
MEYTHTTHVADDVQTTFDWHERKGSFRRLMPPWESVEEVRADPTLEDGSERVFRFPMGPIKLQWVARHKGYNPPHAFEDDMVKGPFKSWHHVHAFVQNDDGTCRVEDRVNFSVPLGALGNLVAGRSVRKRIDRMFTARGNRLTRDIQRHKEFKHLARKKILIAGSSGLIGRQLVAFLDTGGHEVWRLVRRTPASGSNEIQWDPAKGTLNASEIEGFDAVIHLGGAGVGDKRWSKKRMDLIRTSRTESTGLLARTLAGLKVKPGVFIVASAVGYYGNRGDEELDESSTPGEGYLPETCVAWEASAQLAKDAGIRTVHARTGGIVLDATGGGLGKMLLPAKLGAGGPIGRGRQWLSWISMDDEVYALHHLLMTDTCEGPFNLVSPDTVQQKKFAKVLGKVLRRPAFIPTPPFGVWILFGKMGVTLTTDSGRVVPTRLLEIGYRFEHTTLEPALRDTLGLWK